MSTEQVKIFDTTLRDGEQSPGASMNIDGKVRMALQLERLGVDVIEAGFPASSEEDMAAVQAISKAVQGPTIAALARCSERDVEMAVRAVAGAAKPRVHVFIATSELHLREKLKMTPSQLIAAIQRAVRRAKQFVGEVEFSAEDGSRSDRNFLVEALRAAVDSGASVVNVPDTVGYTTPFEFYELVRHVRAHVPASATVSVHCHDDLGMAVANSIAAIHAGARQVECTVNGIGERAGNAALEEVVMALHTREQTFPFHTGIDRSQILATSQLLTEITGMAVQANKAIVGGNAFAHESGIHQDGLLKNRATYEIMQPEAIGWRGHAMVIGKHSGRSAIRDRLGQLGVQVEGAALDRVVRRIKEMAVVKKVIADDDLLALAVEV